MASMRAATIPAPTPQELHRLQDEAGVEFVDGQLVEKPVSIESCLVEQAIASLLWIESRKSGFAEVFGPTMGYRCFPGEPEKYRKPDASVVARSRLAGIDYSEGFMPIVPDLAVEVVSSNDLATELYEKVEDYLSNGFPLIWVVEPSTRTVTIRRADGSVNVLHADDEITGENALPTFRAKVADFFPPIKASQLAS